MGAASCGCNCRRRCLVALDGERSRPLGPACIGAPSDIGRPAVSPRDGPAGRNRPTSGRCRCRRTGTARRGAVGGREAALPLAASPFDVAGSRRPLPVSYGPGGARRRSRRRRSGVAGCAGRPLGDKAHGRCGTRPARRRKFRTHAKSSYKQRSPGILASTSGCGCDPTRNTTIRLASGRQKPRTIRQRRTTNPFGVCSTNEGGSVVGALEGVRDTRESVLHTKEFRAHARSSYRNRVHTRNRPTKDWASVAGRLSAARTSPLWRSYARSDGRYRGNSGSGRHGVRTWARSTIPAYPDRSVPPAGFGGTRKDVSTAASGVLS